MNVPKLHHYVPRFYLKRFADSNGALWVLDKTNDNVFCTGPAGLAAEKGFYEAPELRGTGTSPTFLETQFSALEGEAAKITDCWLRQINTNNKIVIPDVNRDIISLYVATQLFRTAEQRAIFAKFVQSLENYGKGQPAPAEELKNLHARLLCDDSIIGDTVEALKSFIWIFARNRSDVSFYTSDQPVLLKSADNKNWLVTPHIREEGVQVIFPLSPSVILYCKERTYWQKLERFDNCVSPVDFTGAMADHENSGQVGLSRRFVFASAADFTFARMFCDQNPQIRDPDRDRFDVPDCQT